MENPNPNPYDERRWAVKIGESQWKCPLCEKFVESSVAPRHIKGSGKRPMDLTHEEYIGYSDRNAAIHDELLKRLNGEGRVSKYSKMKGARGGERYKDFIERLRRDFGVPDQHEIVTPQPAPQPTTIPTPQPTPIPTPPEESNSYLRKWNEKGKKHGMKFYPNPFDLNRYSWTCKCGGGVGSNISKIRHSTIDSHINSIIHKAYLRN